ncbi:MAG: hypothetical protein GF315_06775 [candidate division Zixibacteria bacterium]|nr:hypothetical protein [candidate division Zixibacteria bacterium]
MNIEVEKINLKLKRPFGLSRGTTSERENVIVNIENNYGEAAPLYYLGQTAEEITEACRELLENFKTEEDIRYLEENPWRDELTGYPAPALAAVSQAIYGYLAQNAGKPLFEYFGISPQESILTSYSIGIVKPDELEAILNENPGYSAYKLKMGSDDDIEVIKKFREISDAELRLDVNGGWSLNEAIDKMNRLLDYDVEFIEQPIPSGNLDGLDTLTTETDIRVFVDEDLNKFGDIVDLYGKVHGINVKLSKCGLIFDTLRIIQYAKQLGMQVLLGCMVESSVGITAAAHLAGLVDYVDLDGNLLISNDPFEGVITQDGTMNLPLIAGMGVRRN